MQWRLWPKDWNDWSEDNEGRAWKIAVFTTTTRMWINDEAHNVFAAKSGVQKVAFWVCKVAF